MSYCAPGKGDRISCYSHKQLQQIAREYNATLGRDHPIKISQSKRALWNSLNNRLSDRCEKEYCWLEQGFIKTLDPAELSSSFKPKKPFGK